MRLRLADERRQLARGLPVHEFPAAHEMPPIGRDAFVVEPGRGEPAGLGAIADQVHDGRAELQRAGVARLDEAGAGEIRLPPERAIQLGRVADGLVDREEQLRRIDDEVVFAGATGFDFSFSTTSWPARSASRTQG